MIPQKFLLLNCLLLSLLTGCVTSIPVHEASTPETLGGWGFHIASFSGSSPAIATVRDDITSTKNKMMLMGGGYGIGLPWGLELDLDVFGGGTGVGGLAGLKKQWMGANKFNAESGNFSQTTIVRSFSSSAPDTKMQDISTNSPYYSGSLNATGASLAHIIGYRPAGWLVVYLGPKYITGQVKGEYKAVQDGPVVLTETRSFWMGGGVLGMGLVPHGKHIGFDLVMEVQAMNVPGVFTEDRKVETYSTMTMVIPFSFGG